MNTETMLEFLRRRPFQPFEVRMRNGDAYQIREPEMAFLLKSSFILGNPKSDDIIFRSLLDIADVKTIPAPTGDPDPRENGKDH